MEVLKVLVISMNMDHMGSPKEQWAAIFETEDHGGKFLVMHIIVFLSWKEAT